MHGTVTAVLKYIRVPWYSTRAQLHAACHIHNCFFRANKKHSIMDNPPVSHATLRVSIENFQRTTRKQACLQSSYSYRTSTVVHGYAFHFLISVRKTCVSIELLWFECSADSIGNLNSYWTYSCSRIMFRSIGFI